MSFALLWTERLVAVSVLLQTFELMSLRARMDQVLGPSPAYNLLLFFNAAAALAALLGWGQWPFALMWLVTVVTAARWYGSFNGGSDAMTFTVLSAVLVARIQPSAAHGCLLFIAVQVCLSYFVAGTVKVLNPQWRSGTALSWALTASPAARGGRLSHYLCRHPKVSAWLVIVFELLFPLSLVSPRGAVAFAALGFGFHIVNTFLLGLNRFLWAWLAGYPALVYTAAQIRFI